MARIVFGSYLIRYPLGGMVSYVLQYLVGLKRLGHEVIFVEKADHPQACFDPVAGCMTDDPSRGLATVAPLFERFGLDDGLCFVDFSGSYHGMSRQHVEAAFASADAFLDMGTHGTWLDEAQASGVRVLLDGEPGFNQIKMATGSGGPPVAYDLYYSNGYNLGTDRSSAPTAGVEWRHLPHPVVTDLYEVSDPPPGAAFTTLMNWRSHDPIAFRGRSYGQKDVEFERFIDLPSRARAPLEIAAAGPDVPLERLSSCGWRLRDALEPSRGYESFHGYIDGSLGEFTVCKNVFVALNTGWFSDRSAAYLAHGRPVVLQETGFSDHLPTGEGLFAVSTVEEAATAIEDILVDRERHARAAREIAEALLDTVVVLQTFCREIGL